MKVQVAFLFLLAACATVAAQSGDIQAKSASRFAPVDRAWALLDSGVKETGYEKRAQSLAALGQLPNNAKAKQLAIEGLKDHQFEVRTAAAVALGEMKAKGAVGPLKEALKDRDDAVVMAAAASLHELGDPVAYAVYYQVLTGKRKEGLIGENIKELHDPKKFAEFAFDQGIWFVPFVGSVWGAVPYLFKDASPERIAAIHVLMKDPDEVSHKALREAATGDKKWHVQVAAIRAISQRGDPADVDAMASLLTHDRTVVQYNAAAAVIHLGAKQVGRNPR